MKRTIVDVKWNSRDSLWDHSVRASSAGGSSSHKRMAVAAALKYAREHQPSQVIIRGKDGRIQEERTYPRSSDPRRSKG